MSTPTSYAPTSIYSMKPKQSALSADGSYGELCKFVLRRRMLRVLILSAIVTWICTNLWSFSPKNGVFQEILASLAPSHLVLIGLTYALGLLPSFVLLRLHLRSQYSKPQTKLHPTLASRLSSTVSRVLLQYAAVYAIQGSVFAFSYCVSAGLREWDDPRLSVFAPTLRHRFNLNERFVFLLSSNAILGIAYAFRTLAFNRQPEAWPDFTTRPPHRPNFIPRLQRSVLPTAYFAASISITFIILYYLNRILIWRTVLYFGFFLRPYMSTFVRAKYSPVSLGMSCRTLAVNMLTALTWETMRVLLEVYSSEPIVYSRFAPNPNQCLISGIVSTDRYIQHHAFHELSVFAQTISPEASSYRKTFFSDLKTPHPPTSSIYSSGTPSSGAWSVVVREALLVLGRDYQSLLRRGGSPPPPAPAALPASSPPSDTHTKKANETSIVKPPTGIFRAAPAPTSQVIADSFSSEGASTNVLSNIVDTAQRGAASIPNIFLGESTSSRPSAVAAAKAVVPTKASPFALAASIKTLPNLAQLRSAVAGAAEQHLVRRLPPSARYHLYDIQWLLFGSNVDKVQGVLRGRKMDVWIVESLSYLTAHSLAEDAYGVVQRDVPRVLEALLSFLNALETYAQELERAVSSTHSAPTDIEGMKEYLELRKRKESESIGELIGPLLTALRGGVKLIAGAYGDRLESFKFSITTAERLQAVVDG